MRGATCLDSDCHNWQPASAVIENLVFRTLARYLTERHPATHSGTIARQHGYPSSRQFAIWRHGRLSASCMSAPCRVLLLTGKTSQRSQTRRYVKLAFTKRRVFTVWPLKI